MVYCTIWLYFGCDTTMGLYLHMFRAYGPIIGFRGSWGFYNDPLSKNYVDISDFTFNL